jgi:hypothetical protein
LLVPFVSPLLDPLVLPDDVPPDGRVLPDDVPPDDRLLPDDVLPDDRLLLPDDVLPDDAVPDDDRPDDDRRADVLRRVERDEVPLEARRVESDDAVLWLEPLEVDWALATLASPSVTTAAMPQTMEADSCLFICASPASVVAARRRGGPAVAVARDGCRRCEADRVPVRPRPHERRLTVELARAEAADRSRPAVIDRTLSRCAAFCRGCLTALVAPGAKSRDRSRASSGQ